MTRVGSLPLRFRQGPLSTLGDSLCTRFRCHVARAKTGVRPHSARTQAVCPIARANEALAGKPLRHVALG